RYVLLEEGPGQYVRRNVVTGRRGQDVIEIRDGKVVPGDRIVTVGGHELATLFEPTKLRFTPQAEKNLGLGELATAQLRPIADIVELPGVIELPPERRALAAARLSGTVHRILVDRDQTVSAGEVVAEVASLEF